MGNIHTLRSKLPVRAAMSAALLLALASIPEAVMAQDCGGGSGITQCANANAIGSYSTSVGYGSLADGIGGVAIGAYSSATDPAPGSNYAFNAPSTAVVFHSSAYNNGVAIGA